MHLRPHSASWGCVHYPKSRRRSFPWAPSLGAGPGLTQTFVKLLPVGFYPQSQFGIGIFLLLDSWGCHPHTTWAHTRACESWVGQGQRNLSRYMCLRWWGSFCLEVGPRFEGIGFSQFELRTWILESRNVRWLHVPVRVWTWTYVQNRKEQRSSIVLGTFIRIQDVFTPWPTEFARLCSSPSSRIMWSALRSIGWQVALIEIKSIRKGLWMLVVGLDATSSFVSFGVTCCLETMGIVWSCR